jgi:asparagine synthetase B (glutamine-hydrolysing)
MCGFLISRNKDANNTYIRRRGPDLTRTVEVEGYYFTHNLLSVTGDLTAQPFIDGEVVCVYNGEIYNHPFEHSDGEVLIPLYRRFGPDFARHLDGEFAIAIYDFGRRLAVLATDPFASKPLYIKDKEAASYPSGLGGGERVPPNTVLVVDLDSGGHQSRIVDPFDFDHQWNESYDHWIAAFERAVEKRAKDGCYITLSSGYDSGAIDCALRKLGVIYKAYSIEGRENRELLAKRNRQGVILRMETEEVARQEEFLLAWAENETCRVAVEGQMQNYHVLQDPATRGLALIHSLARAEGRKVCLSGQGADEIMSDYSHWPWATELQGYFPEKLSPWRNFAGNYQAAYLMKEEVVAGVFGIETRYPFLDRAVVQEFLWLRPELKNRHYKAPLREYLRRNNYPIEENVKIGFSILQE